MVTAPNRWHRWLFDVRFGGDAAARAQALTEFLSPVRDTVLDNANLQPADTLLDADMGDGLIAFGALKWLSPSGQVIFSDTSQDLFGSLPGGRRGRKTAGLVPVRPGLGRPPVWHRFPSARALDWRSPQFPTDRVAWPKSLPLQRSTAG
jgi:hypothetical protein